MTLRTKGIWRALKAERSPEEGEVFIGEEEVIKENFSLTTDAPEKGKGTPMLARATASTNTSTTNTNAVSTDEGGANGRDNLPRSGYNGLTPLSLCTIPLFPLSTPRLFP